MKILKVKITREAIDGGTHYEYPPEYDPKKIQVVAYETSNPDNIAQVRGRGNHEYLIGIVEDKDAQGFLASPDIVEVSQAEAETDADNWIKPVTKIIDQGKVLEILAKVSRRESLTEEDYKAIDPDDKSTAGLARARGFKERLSDTSTTIAEREVGRL